MDREKQAENLRKQILLRIEREERRRLMVNAIGSAAQFLNEITLMHEHRFN